MEVGKIVYLKSGGPRMTVIGENSDGHLDCGWFDGGEYKTRPFPETVLTTDDPTAALEAKEREIRDSLAKATKPVALE